MKDLDLIGTILVLRISAIVLAISICFIGNLVSLINPWFAVEYCVAAILIVIIAHYLIYILTSGKTGSMRHI